MIIQDGLARRELNSHRSIDPNAAEMYAIMLSVGAFAVALKKLFR
jgi:hypothetical protein